MAPKPDEELFQRNFEAYKRHLSGNGPMSKELNRWVTKHQCLYRSNDLDTERKKCFDDIPGFNPGKSQDQTFEETFAAFAKFKKAHGHCNPTAKTDRALARTKNNLRNQYRSKMKGCNTRLTDERVTRLRDLGFIFPNVKDERVAPAAAPAAAAPAPDPQVMALCTMLGETTLELKKSNDTQEKRLLVQESIMNKTQENQLLIASAVKDHGDRLEKNENDIKANAGRTDKLESEVETLTATVKKLAAKEATASAGDFPSTGTNSGLFPDGAPAGIVTPHVAASSARVIPPTTEGPALPQVDGTAPFTPFADSSNRRLSFEDAGSDGDAKVSGDDFTPRSGSVVTFGNTVVPLMRVLTEAAHVSKGAATAPPTSMQGDTLGGNPKDPDVHAGSGGPETVRTDAADVEAAMSIEVERRVNVTLSARKDREDREAEEEAEAKAKAKVKANAKAEAIATKKIDDAVVTANLIVNDDESEILDGLRKGRANCCPMETIAGGFVVIMSHKTRRHLGDITLMLEAIKRMLDAWIGDGKRCAGNLMLVLSDDHPDALKCILDFCREAHPYKKVRELCEAIVTHHYDWTKKRAQIEMQMN